MFYQAFFSFFLKFKRKFVRLSYRSSPYILVGLFSGTMKIVPKYIKRVIHMWGGWVVGWMERQICGKTVSAYMCRRLTDFVYVCMEKQYMCVYVNKWGCFFLSSGWFGVVYPGYGKCKRGSTFVGCTNDSYDRIICLCFWLDIVFVIRSHILFFSLLASSRKTVTCMIRNGIVEWKSFFVLCVLVEAIYFPKALYFCALVYFLCACLYRVYMFWYTEHNFSFLLIVFFFSFSIIVVLLGCVCGCVVFCVYFS